MKSKLYNDREYFGNIQDYVFYCLKEHKDTELCVWRRDGGTSGCTYGQMYDYVKQIGTFLNKNGKPGAHLALLGKTTEKWIASYLGALCYGVTVTPIDILLSKEEILRQFSFADCEILFFDSAYLNVAEYIRGSFPNVLCVPIDKEIPGFDASVGDIISSKAAVIEPPKVFENSLGEIVFTSGTTGVGKGVMLSSGNIAASVMFGIRLVNLSESDRMVSILPNNHSFELAVGILTPMYFGMSLIINNSIRSLKKDMQTFSPTVMLVVPALLEMFKKEIIREADRSGKTNRFNSALRTTRFLRHIGIDVRRKAFGDVIDYFGGGLRILICGGAFLSKETLAFFEDLGIYVIEGYGITECSPIVSCNTDRSSRALGEINPYCKVKSIDGEICVLGKNVMLGYYKDKEATDRAIVDGWFHTGDLGSVDKYNYLSLSGRKDNLIVNSNGENVSPEIIEDYLTTCDIVSACLAYGEDNLITVSVYPNYQYAELAGITDIEQCVNDAVAVVNGKLPPKQRVERVHIREKPFEMTTTMKIKRNSV